MFGRTVFAALSAATSAFIACIPPSGTVPGSPDAGGDEQITPTQEAEPNNSFAQSTPAVLDVSGRARLVGRLTPLEEAVDPADFYSLGPVKAGDRIIVSIQVLDPELVPVVAIFDSQNKLFILKSARDRAAGASGPLIDEVFRHDSDDGYFVITRALTRPLTAGAYEAVVRVERGGVVPPPRRQTFVLNFNGGTVTIRGEQVLDVRSFDAADIDPRYAGWTDTVKRWIVETFRQNYARFDVVVLNSEIDALPADGAFSTVYFGGYDPEGLGIALSGTDPYNHDPNDDALVFTERFTPDLFTNPPTAEQLGVAIGNIASHEAGHLLGLNHVHDATAVMNSYDAPDNLLTDQRFGRESIDNAVLPIFFTDLAQEQDDILLLAETVGRAASAANSAIAVGSQPSCVTVADFSGDGLADLMVDNTVSSEVSFLRNDGGGEFVTDRSFFAGWGPMCSTAADFNGDGLVDLAVANLVSNSVAVLLGDGSGGFLGASEVGVQEGPTGIVAADFDADGRMDLATANNFGRNVSVLGNKGDGTFEPEIVAPAGPFPMSVASGDLNGDGRVDLVVANSDIDDELSGVVVMLQGEDGGFTGKSVFRELSVPSYAAVADVNNDGRPDILIADLLFDAAYVLLNAGDGAFADPVRYVVGHTPLHITAADVDGDAYPDLIVANSADNDVSVLRNHGDGTFAAEWPYGVGVGPRYVAPADLDGDGDLDLAVVNETGETVSILLNLGNGTYAVPIAGQ